MATLQELMSELSDNLDLEGVTRPDTDRMVRLLNRAKNEVMAQLELLGQDQFTVRKTFAVAANDASIALPDGSGADPAVKRILGLTRTDGNAPVECVIHAHWEREQYDGMEGDLIAIMRGRAIQPTLYREGNALYFTRTGGAAEAMTLVLRYAGKPVDLTMADLSNSYSLIPDEWTDCIAIFATIVAIPAANPARGKWSEIWKKRVETMEQAGTRLVQTGPAQVKYDDGG
jgi:hypothetical protein